jgi:hypothetical protein
MTSRRGVGLLLGVISTAALLINWVSVAYFSSPHAYAARHLWTPIAEHRILKFALIMAVGVICGALAGLKHSKAWFIVVALNVVSYVLELAVS